MKVAPRIVVLGLALLAGRGCGRTAIDPAVPCSLTDPPRPCQAPCGPGTESCVDGVWQTCKALTTTRACSGVCGEGSQECADGKWLQCVIPVATRPCSSVCGPGTETCRDEQWGACDAPLPKPPVLHTVVRDFHATHPDFELPLQGDHLDPGIVAPMLGADDKPVYAGNPTTETTSGAASFDQWYRDVPGQNETTTLDLQLVTVPALPDIYIYSNDRFFPIDNRLFGNEGYPHNYHFTLETHTHFRYLAGQSFSFSGDDDVWVFINRRLAIDLGGIHSALGRTVNLDDIAGSFALTPGQTYQLDIFFAERHTVASDFVVETSIADASSCQ
jgi:fibro-slime domain-containing protein